MARPSGPIPPNSPMPVRRAKSCQTSCTAADSTSNTTYEASARTAIGFWP